jgi:sugar lactone lactonase YvrE
MKDYSNVGTDHQSSTSYQTKPTHNLNGDQKVNRISWTIAAALVAGLFLPVNAAQADPWKTIASTPLRSMTKDQDGNMYIGSTGSSIFKIDPSGEVANIGPTGNGARWVAVDSSGNIYNVNTSDGTVSKITPAGVIKNDFGATGVGSRPFKLAVDTAGNVFTLNVGNRTVSKITSAGVSTAAYLTFEEHAIPNTIATDQNDNLYVGICGDRIRTDLPSNQIDSPANLINEVRKITPSKVVTVLATTGQCPGDITIDPSGNIYTANYGAQFGWNVSKITPTGVSTILGTTGEYPVAIAIDPLGNIYTANDRSKDVSKITPAGDPTILGSTGNASPFGILYLSGNIYTSNIDGTVSKFPLTTTTSGSAPNSQVATISSGVTGVIIPSNAALPATTLKFGGAVPTSVTVVPVATNPAPASATPFTISGSTKIVDIQITGTFNGSATVCLDGNSTDHLFHYVGGKWEELPSRSYANGQVCGVTTSFSPFTAAEKQISAPLVSAEAAARAAAEAAAAQREAEKQSARAEIISKLKTAKDLTVDTFVKADIPGITTSNIAAFQTELLALPDASRTDISQIIKVARKFEILGSISSDRVKTLSPTSFVEIGLIPATSKNKVALVSAIRKLPVSGRDSYAEIKAAIDAETAAIQARKDRLAAIIARNKARS